MTPDRRSFLATAGLAALAVGTSSLTGCTRTPGGAAPQVGAGVTLPAADVPVGGGVIMDAASYVVTQPAAGEYRAFSKLCTHQGCPVSSIADGQIHCRCHGAAFSIEDGSVTNPPADKPLPAASVTLDGDTLRITGA